jgi:peptidoglycan/LPS O-acetylase OafA/YrhL
MSASTKILPVLPDTPTLVQRPLVAARELEQAAKLATVFQFRHIPELDGFRGIAILLVIAGHFGTFHGPTAEIRAYAKAVAELGVLLFFVLSGFLITGLLCRERIARGTVDLKQFYLRRVLRLAPALFLFLSTVMLLSNMGWITDVPKLEISGMSLVLAQSGGT